MLKKILAPLFITSMLGSMSAGCIVHTHSGPSARRGPCPAGYTKENGVCRERRNGHHDNGHHNGEVIVRDHRR